MRKKTAHLPPTGGRSSKAVRVSREKAFFRIDQFFPQKFRLQQNIIVGHGTVGRKGVNLSVIDKQQRSPADLIFTVVHHLQAGAFSNIDDFKELVGMGLLATGGNIFLDSDVFNWGPKALRAV